MRKFTFFSSYLFKSLTIYCLLLSTSLWMHAFAKRASITEHSGLISNSLPEERPPTDQSDELLSGRFCSDQDKNCPSFQQLIDPNAIFQLTRSCSLEKSILNGCGKYKRPEGANRYVGEGEIAVQDCIRLPTHNKPVICRSSANPSGSGPKESIDGDVIQLSNYMMPMLDRDGI